MYLPNRYKVRQPNIQDVLERAHKTTMPVVFENFLNTAWTYSIEQCWPGELTVPEFLDNYGQEINQANEWVIIAETSYSEKGIYHPALMQLEALYEAKHYFYGRREGGRAAFLYQLFAEVVSHFMATEWSIFMEKFHKFKIFWQIAIEENKRLVRFIRRFQLRTFGYWRKTSINCQRFTNVKFEFVSVED